jgi:cellulose synthase/poly-beta-1,6-N-acetylglucosamine synthase-like glycosyltransferase
MISIVITAYKEEKWIAKCIESFLNQKIDDKYEIIVSCPDEGTAKIARKYKEVIIFKDPGKGKSFALNLLFKQLKGDIWVFTDGDNFVEDNSVNEILKLFKNKEVGIVGGRPVSLNKKDNMLGYWSHLLADCANKLRIRLSKQNRFLELSAYLFAFRKGVIKDVPLDVAEDAIIPYIFWSKGYKIGYAPKAKVYVKNPTNLKDWIKQRKRTANAHTKLTKYIKDFPKVKSFSNEIKEGTFLALAYPRNLKEIYWTFLLFFFRAYVWISLFFDLKFKKEEYVDGWERVESAR